ncbi:hypothetical protein BDW68DRAFT_196503 [Aspergillus falconensis]
MVSLQAVRAHNAALKSLGAGLVAVFVGGTSGISLSTALSLARHTVSPKIYLIGRNKPAAESAIKSIKALNPSAEPVFLQSDISLLKNVDRACEHITAREKYVNILFMTPGYMTLKGRDETGEGLDRKFALHYYARMRFVNRLLPLLTSAANLPSSGSGPRHGPGLGSEEPRLGLSLARVISVLDPHVPFRPFGLGQAILDYEDLSLKHSFSLKKCGHHASLMNNFYLEGTALRHRDISFVHAYPSGVDTGILRGLPGGRVVRVSLSVLLAPFMVPLEESGERHLFAATSGRFPCAAEGMGEEGTRGDAARDVAVGSDGRQGSGCYLLNWDGEVFPEHGRTRQRREEGAVERVVEHTEAVFRRVCEEGLSYP